MHIRISLGTKFHFKQAILNFGTKYAQKGYLHNSGQIQRGMEPLGDDFFISRFDIPILLQSKVL